ncbi:hypothetical protein [Noviherbaspirillum galbum]|uniref:Uncharacterized protein n=1 Tax=Noviherbaspirillum galbum TaxID=2709383 RepID=A0A6B3SSV7_9BURK|nr:hypothetical protein [Noviherbaspirillum galbum]NEX61916.1 hypothetical protein [Noviherbaspirillum galbum]
MRVDFQLTRGFALDENSPAMTQSPDVIFSARIVAAFLLAGMLAMPYPGMAANAMGQKLDKYLPAKLGGWLTDPPSDPDNMFDHSLAVNQTFSLKNQEGNLDIGIQRIQKNSRIGLPKLEQAKLGRNPEGGGVTSMLAVKDHKALLVYDAENKAGKLTMVAGTCVVTVEGGGVIQAQLMAAADAIDLKGLDNVCQ